MNFINTSEPHAMKHVRSNLTNTILTIDLAVVVSVYVEKSRQASKRKATTTTTKRYDLVAIHLTALFMLRFCIGLEKFIA